MTMTTDCYYLLKTECEVRANIRTRLLSIRFPLLPEDPNGRNVSAMLSRNNMLNMKREVRKILLVNPAIFTTVVSPLANKVFGSVIHYACGTLETHARALSRMSATKSISSI